MPPLGEQRAIADYLDTETARIDALITKKRRLITLLEERWLASIEDEIAGWRAVKLKRIAIVEYGLGQPPPLADSGVPIIRATNISRGSITEDGMIYAALEDLPLDRAPLLEEGELLVVRSGAWTGDSALVTGEWAGCSPGYDLRVRAWTVDANCIAPQFLAASVWRQIELMRSRAAQPHLNAEEVGDLVVRVPPSIEVEASALVRFAAARTFCDSMTSTLETQLSLLREHRQALITAAVTGELRVPGVAV